MTLKMTDLKKGMQLRCIHEDPCPIGEPYAEPGDIIKVLNSSQQCAGANNPRINRHILLTSEALHCYELVSASPEEQVSDWIDKVRGTA